MCWATSFLRRRATSRRPCSSTPMPDTATTNPPRLITSRASAVYVASNDGMLHAFNAETGKELWAYVPEMVLPQLYRLADTNYSQNHQYFVDGTPEVGDVCPTAPTTPCSGTQWKTIIVGGLNRGGKGYYALDITDPANPAAAVGIHQRQHGLFLRQSAHHQAEDRPMGGPADIRLQQCGWCRAPVRGRCLQRRPDPDNQHQRRKRRQPQRTGEDQLPIRRLPIRTTRPARFMAGTCWATSGVSTSMATSARRAMTRSFW